MDSGGVEGFFDTFLFLTILSVASCIILNSIPALLRSEDCGRRDTAIKYAASSLDAILSSTLPNTSYQGCHGGDIGLANDTTVKDFLLDETYLVWSGWPLSSFTACDSRIEEMIGHLVTPAYRFSLATGVDDVDGFRDIVVLGDTKNPVGYSASRQYSVNGVATTVSLTLWWS